MSGLITDEEVESLSRTHAMGTDVVRLCAALRAARRDLRMALAGLEMHRKRHDDCKCALEIAEAEAREAEMERARIAEDWRATTDELARQRDEAVNALITERAASRVAEERGRVAAFSDAADYFDGMARVVADADMAEHWKFAADCMRNPRGVTAWCERKKGQ